MVSYTGRLKLAKQAEQGEVVDVALLNQNFDDIDKHIGLFECTSATRPAAPYVGMQILETDTGFRQYWTGTEWLGRPWYLERYYAGADYNVGYAWSNFRYDNTRTAATPTPEMGQPSDWGLTGWTQAQGQANQPDGFVIPASGLWIVSLSGAGPDTGVARQFAIYRKTAGSIIEVHGTSGVASTNYTTTFMLTKGDTVHPQIFTSAAVVVRADSKADPNGRNFISLAWAGPGRRVM